MANSVAPTNSRNTHHINLTKAGTEVGLILVDRAAGADIKGIERGAYPNSAIHFYQGDKEYGDQEPPYRSIAQKDWSGGRGSKDFDDAANRYLDAYRAYTLKQGKVLLGAQEHYATGYRTLERFLPDETSGRRYMVFQTLTSTQRYLAIQFTAAANLTATKLELWIRKVGSPGLLSAALFTNSGGNPSGAIGSEATIAAATIEDVTSELYRFTISAGLTATTAYHVVIWGAATDDATNHWEVMTSTNHDGTKSSDGLSWSAATGKGIYYRITGADTAQKFQFFEYKRALYAVSQPDSGGNSTLYMNGDRGAADSNAANLDKLIDGTKSWTTNQWVDAIVLITKGTGSDESQPWRTVTANNGTQLTVDSNWLIQHDTTTEYVIIDTDVWQAASGWLASGTISPAAYVTDVAVTDDFVYFARGEDAADPSILRYQEYNNAGVWTGRSEADFDKAVKLLPIRDPALGTIMWGARNNHDFWGVSVFKMRVPPFWGDMYHSIGKLLETDTPWADWAVSNVTQGTANGATKIQVDAAHTTGIVAVKNLDEPVDITQALALGFKIHSTAVGGVASGDLQLILDDQENLGAPQQPSAVKLATVAAGAPTYTDLADAIDESDETYAAANVAATGFMLVMSAVKFNKININFQTANATASVLSAEYSKGAGFAAVSGLSDGTTTGGATFGQDGSITFTPSYDWEPVTIDGITGYAIMLKVTVNLDAGTTIHHIYVERKNNTTLNIPALGEAEWTWVEIPITPESFPDPDDTSIRSIALKVAVDNAAQFIYLHGGIHLISHDRPYKTLPRDANITNLVPYAGSADTPTLNPWVLTESGVYEIQTQNDDVVIPLALAELGEIRDEDSGRAAVSNGVYLFFNLGDKIQRYYNRQLEDIGPDKDEGLPSGRTGTPAFLLSYPGRVIAGIDAAAGTSSLLAYEGGGWHEMYRAPRAASRLRAGSLQAIPGKQHARLWISQGSDLLWIPLSLNPEQDADYTYVHEATVESSRFYVGRKDIEKFWKSLQLASEDLTTVTRVIQVKADYRLSGESAWTELSDVFDTSPTQEADISSAYDKSGEWIEVRLRLQTEDGRATPVVLSTVLKAMEAEPQKETYTMTFRLVDRDKQLDGLQDPVSAGTKWAQLDAWAGEATPVLMNAFSSVYDNHYVRIQSKANLRLLRHWFDDENREHIIGQMTLLEI